MPKIGKFGRSAACILLVLAVFAVYELRLFQWQVLRGDEFEQISLSNRTDTIEIEAARGEILDRERQRAGGQPLQLQHCIRLRWTWTTVPATQPSSRCWTCSWSGARRGRDRLPIVLAEDGTYQYAEDSESAIAALQESLELAEYATAEDCMSALTRRYDCQATPGRTPGTWCPCATP